MNLDPVKTKQLVDYWRRGSLEDLNGAKEIVDHTSRYASGLFFAHLCLEKALKALYCQKTSQHAPYTHNLLALVEKTGLQLSEADIQLMAEINEFNLEARYPDEKFTIYQRASKDVASAYLRDVERIRSWILQQLSNSP